MDPKVPFTNYSPHRHVLWAVEPMRYGYACINLSLAAEKVQVNRSMMKRTFLEKGLPQASALALANFKDLESIVDRNIQDGFLLYRMSSDMVPWMSEYELDDLPDIVEIRDILSRCGEKAGRSGMRLTYHPGPFNVLASPSPDVTKRTIKELRQHAEIMDMLGQPQSVFAKINIHVGGAYGDKTAALARFADMYMQLPEHVRKRLTVENDDKVNMYSVQDLLWLHGQVRIPVVFDAFHHRFCTGGLDEAEAMHAAIGTWPQGIRPVIHFSSSKQLHEDPTAGATAHADHIHQAVQLHGSEADIMFEAKAKEQAILRYLERFGSVS